MSDNGTYHECDYCGAYCCKERDEFEDNIVSGNKSLEQQNAELIEVLEKIKKIANRVSGDKSDMYQIFKDSKQALAKHGVK